MVMTNAADYHETPAFHDGLAKVVSVKEARDLGLHLDDVEVVEGSTFIFNDKSFLNHFYHLVGEMFLGAWRVYTSVLANPFDRTPQKIMRSNGKSILHQVPPIDKFIFAHAQPDRVFDHARLNEFFFDSAFPQVPLAFEEEWQARADSLKLFRFDMVTIADRWSGHMGGSSKPIYKGPVSLKDPSHARSKPVITYLSRQKAVFRTLSQEAHESLVKGLKSLEKEGLAEVNIEEFTDADPKDDQARLNQLEQIFVTLHGNGLTNLIWMTPDAHGRSAIYEIQQPGMFTDDYAIISEALGIDHWIIGGRDPELE
ncbi:hypothetical protein QFC19_001731 [Naganishia cerealis]|uniref:Uncharacterized protein n=1 Tax=Naganishia cerealis TaxID=610337 RepID=A0ACC2WF59_9TREE|nr:hypothetical protein QFC19_001731 [Naganishia cerealis]